MIIINIKLYNNDCQHLIKNLLPSSIDLICTSPPYWAKRIYDHQENAVSPIGAEPTPEEYVERLADLFAEMGILLKDTGNLYINIGDSYFGSGSGASKNNMNPEVRAKSKEKYLPTKKLQPKIKQNGRLYQNKQLLLIPSRFAIAMQERGWILREDIIWHKTNPLPTGVKDRCNSTYEHIFHFVKQRKYYFNTEKAKTQGKNGKMKVIDDVWDIPTQAIRGTEHTASYPEALVERIIDCGCSPEGIIFDPFLGTGTTGVVAKRKGIDFIGCEISEKYLEYARERIEKTD